MSRSAVIRALAAAVAVLGVAAPGATAGTVALQPIGARAYYTFRAAAPTTLHGKIRVTNRGSRSATARVYGVDSATGPTTGATYLTDHPGGRRVGAWIRLAASRITLAPHASRVLPFTVRVPRDARPGDHLGGITADAGVQPGRSVKRGRSSFRINVRTVTVIAVQVTVPGARTPALGPTGVRAGGMRGYQQLLVGLTNAGNILVKSRGALVVRDTSGRTVKRMRFPVDTFVPETHVADPVLVPGRPLAAGRYRATVALRYGRRFVQHTYDFRVGDAELAQVFGSPPAAASATASAGRVALIAGGALLVMLALVATWRISRRRALRELELRAAAAADAS